jgi:hypothetical protein
VQDCPDTFPHGMRSVLLVMDNAAWHARAVADGLAARLGLRPQQILQHPASSPDFQGPVEYSHSHLVAAVQQELAQHGETYTQPALMARVQKCWKQCITKEMVVNMFKKLKHTYENVKESKGHWGGKND